MEMEKQMPGKQMFARPEEKGLWSLGPIPAQHTWHIFLVQISSDSSILGTGPLSKFF